MSLISVNAQFKSKLAQLGRATLNTLYPKDFEAYLVSIELVDSNGNTVDYFSWPILPDEISDNHIELTSVRKTMSGINVLTNPTFAPRQVLINGNFGRNFKIIVNGQPVEFAGFGLSVKDGKFNIAKPNLLENPIPQFSSFAKTGYGCIKYLEAIKEKSKQLDDNGKPFSLYLYNPILGNNYQVIINNFRHMQNKNQYNMIPAYSLQMTAIAPLDSIVSRKANINSALKNLSFSNLQKIANNVASRLRLIPGLGT